MLKHHSTSAGLTDAAQLNACGPTNPHETLKGLYPRGIDRHLGVPGSEDLARGRGAPLAVLQASPSEPVLRDKDVHIDDIPVGDHAPYHVVHLQLQDGIKWAHDGPHLAHNT